MIKVNQRYFQCLCRSIKMMMVKLAHSTTSVFFILSEKCMFSIFKSFFKEHFLIFIRPFGFSFHFSFNLLNYNFLMLIELLEFNISQLIVIKKLIKNYVKILVAGIFLCNRLHFIRNRFDTERCLLVLKHRKVLVTLHLNQIVKIQQNRSSLKILLSYQYSSNWTQVLIFKSIQKKIMDKPKSVKSSVSITSPKGSLLAEINNLRKELKDIKHSKIDTVLSQKPIKDYSNLNKKTSKQKCVTAMSNSAKDNWFKSVKDVSSPNRLKSSNLVFDTQKSFQIQKKQKKMKNTSEKPIIKEEVQANQITISEIWLKERDRKLKLDIQLNKLRKIILKTGSEQISNQLNYIISLINISTKEYSARLQSLQKNQKDDTSQDALLLKRQQQEIEQLSKKNISLEKTIKQMNGEVKKKKQLDQTLEQLSNLTTIQKNEMRSHNQVLQQMLKQFTEKNIQLQEQNRILSSKLYKKQQQLILLNQDVNYLRLQTENYKQQKKQIHQLYEKTLNQTRDYKRNKSTEIQQILNQKEKWEKQCKLRRNQSEQITALEEQKIALLKQVSELRHICNMKGTQFQEKKSIMHENQKKIISLQSQVYRLKSEIQTVTNQKQFSQFENQKLKQQIDDMKKYLKRNNSRQRIIKSKPEIQKQTSFKKMEIKQVKQRKNSQNEESCDTQSNYISNYQKREHFNKTMKQKQQKLKTLQDIHSMIRKHKNQMHL